MNTKSIQLKCCSYRVALKGPGVGNDSLVAAACSGISRGMLCFKHELARKKCLNLSEGEELYCDHLPRWIMPSRSIKQLDAYDVSWLQGGQEVEHLAAWLLLDCATKETALGGFCSHSHKSFNCQIMASCFGSLLATILNKFYPSIHLFIHPFEEGNLQQQSSFCFNICLEQV